MPRPLTAAGMDDSEQRYVIDEGTGRPILVSPIRLGRPHTTRDKSAACPFCPGHEAATPPEVAAIRRGPSAPDTPGWEVRAVPNLYPAYAHHEVLIEGAAHTEHPAELQGEVLADVLTIYRQRITDMEARNGVNCAFLFKNVGAGAGASIAHNHSQLLGLPEIPPRLVSELDACVRRGCLHCREIATAESEGRVIWADEHHVVLSPSTPKLPFETWVLPREHRTSFHDETHDESLVAILHRTFAGLDRSFDHAPFNLCLHRLKDADFHWHFEIQPRLGSMAALELGGDMYINAITPKECVRRWRRD